MYQDDAEIVYLGIPKKPIKPSKDNDPLMSKIGGVPVRPLAISHNPKHMAVNLLLI